MTDIAFYHLQRSPLAAVLPALLRRTLAAGKRGLVLTGSEERCEDLNALLWTQDPNGWLPHGSARDGSAEAQPIWLTERDENPNSAEYVFLTDGAEVADLGQFERGFDFCGDACRGKRIVVLDRSTETPSDPCQALGVVRQLTGALDVSLGRGAHEFPYPERSEQACTDARSQTVALAGYQGDASMQRIQAGRVGAVAEGVEE